MVSLKTVAEECGVSIATASKALNNHKDISESTRKFVCETAKRLGYLPNLQARALKTHKSNLIGVLLADKAESGLTHMYFSSVLDSFKKHMENLGYDIVFISGKIGDRTMSFKEHCFYRNVDGVLVACVDFESENVQELFQSDIPLVAIDYIKEGVCSVVSDNSQGMSELVNYIYSQGHRDIAYIYGDSSYVTSVRLDSYINTIKMLGLSPNKDYIRQGNYLSDNSAEIITRELLRLHNPPTCIIYPDDYCAMCGLNVIKNEFGNTASADVSVAGYDGIIPKKFMNFSLTTVKQDTYNIGKQASLMLARIISKEDIPQSDRVSVICGSVMNGQTVARLN